MADENDNAELSLPVARVRRIVRSDPEVKIIAADALYLITKATELFVELLTEEAFKETTKQKRKGIKYDDLAAAVKAHEEFEFLSDIIPEKKTVSSLQQQQPDDGDKEKEKEKTPSASSPAAGPRQAQLSFSKK